MISRFNVGFCQGHGLLEGRRRGKTKYNPEYVRTQSSVGVIRVERRGRRWSNRQVSGYNEPSIVLLLASRSELTRSQ